MKTLNLRQSRDFGVVISDSFAYLRTHFKVLGKGLLFFSFPLIIISGILISSGFNSILSASIGNPEDFNQFSFFGFEFYLGFLLLMITFLFIVVIVFKHISLIDQGVEDISMGMLLEDFGRNIFGLIGILVITSVVINIGLFLFIIPGLYLAVKLSLAPAIYVIEGEDFGEALSKSWDITKDYWWFTFGVSFVISIITSVASSAIIFPFYFAGMVFLLASGEPNPETIGLAISIFYGLFMVAISLSYCFPIISQALVYFHLNETKSGRSLFDKIDAIKED